VTGPSNFHAYLVAKQLQLLKEAVPGASRVAVLLNRATPHSVAQLENIQGAAPSLRVTLLPADVRAPADIDRAFVKLSRERADALLIVPDPTWFLGHQRRIAQLALEHRLAAISTVREWADAGGLLSYGADFHDQWRRAANYVDKILSGAKPADLPVEQPTRFELVINLKTARTLQLTFPQSLLLRADHVIE
jgi:putative ABC transport system substrate-binding protein